MPSVETTTWYLVPSLPRSVGLGPVSAPPLICGGTPGQPGPCVVAFFSVGLKRCRSAAAVKVERPWTNDLDRGEDRPILSAAEEDEG